MTPMTYTEAEVDAALCVWDELLSKRSMLSAEEYRTEQERAFDTYWNNNGYAVMRQYAVSLGRWAEEVWLLLSDDQRDVECFDFEFLPRLLDLVHWQALYGAAYGPSWPTARVAYAALFPAPQPEEA